MDRVAVSQQMYVHKGEFIVNKQPEKLIHEPPKFCMHFMLPTLVGLLLCGVPLASVLTLYLKTSCCTIGSTVNTQSQVDQTNASVSVDQVYYCAGTSPYTLWQISPSIGVTMNIDTSSCSFNITPLYFTSMGGITKHWDAAGYTAICYPTTTSFTVYANSLVGWTNAQMLNLAQTEQWTINWFGIYNYKL